MRVQICDNNICGNKSLSFDLHNTWSRGSFHNRCTVSRPYEEGRGWMWILRTSSCWVPSRCLLLWSRWTPNRRWWSYDTWRSLAWCMQQLPNICKRMKKCYTVNDLNDEWRMFDIVFQSSMCQNYLFPKVLTATEKCWWFSCPILWNPLFQWRSSWLRLLCCQWLSVLFHLYDLFDFRVLTNVRVHNVLGDGFSTERPIPRGLLCPRVARAWSFL